MELDRCLAEELVFATVSRNFRKVDELMQCGIDPSLVTDDGTSAFHAAVVLESPMGPKIVSRMLSYGADPNIKTATGLSPLHIAAMWGRVDTINVLLDHGADITIKDEDDMSALDYAEEAEQNKEKCIDALTKFRPIVKRKSGCFLTKSRFNLDRIIGGADVLFNTFDTTVNQSFYDQPQRSISTQTNLTDIEMQKTPPQSPLLTHLSVDHQVLAQSPSRHDRDDSFLEETLFKSCNNNFDQSILASESCAHIASSTMIEDAQLNSDSQCDHSQCTNHHSKNVTSTGYHGDTSSNEHIEDDADETFWSVWSTPPHLLSSKESPITFRKKSNSKHKRTPRGRAGSDLFIPKHRQLKSSSEETDSNKQATCEEDDELIVNLTNLLNEESDRTHSLTANKTTIDNEATIDYSSTNNVTDLVEYYEMKENETKPFKSPDRSAFFDIVNLKDNENGVHVNESLLDYSGVTVDYDWMDVSQINPSESLNGVTNHIPASILALSNNELRTQLKQHGECPGPISQSTRVIYQKHLAKLKRNEELQKPVERFHDYTPEMRQVLLGSSRQTKQQNEDLEVEMAYVFENPDKHTWREGTMKTSFNYILLDPRVTKNLPARADELNFEEQLKIFVAATFYIGKGKRSRPYEHFHEALKYEKSDKSKSASIKVKMIDKIWEAGLGVASVHIFHSIIPVEAYTREACMIEAMGLSRLTNVKDGDYYGPASNWNIKKKRLLGVYLLTKAMKIYLIEGERQIKRKDLSK